MTESEEAALAVARAYIDTFNTRDPVRWLATMHYPHARHADGKLAIDQTPPQNVAQVFTALERSLGWACTRLDSAKVVQSDAGKVHVAVRVTRLRADGSDIHSFDSLYVITKQEGRWAIALRSSYAPDRLPARR